MSDFLIMILIFYGLAVVIVSVLSLLFIRDQKICLLTPKEIYDKTSMNWFGCIFVWFLEFIINPITWIFITIVKVVTWLFTVGRK